MIRQRSIWGSWCGRVWGDAGIRRTMRVQLISCPPLGAHGAVASIIGSCGAVSLLDYAAAHRETFGFDVQNVYEDAGGLTPRVGLVERSQ